MPFGLGGKRYTVTYLAVLFGFLLPVLQKVPGDSTAPTSRR